MYSLQLKVFALVFGLLLLIQSATLYTLYRKVQAEAEHTLTERLDTGSRVFRDQFDSRHRSLTIFSDTLARDFGLLEAFQQGRKNLLVALDRRRQQVGADMAVAVDLKGVIRADTSRPGLAGQPFELGADAMPYAATHPLFLDLGDTVYQMIAAPLRAPTRVGWVLLGFRLDESMAQQYAKLTSLQVSFLEQQTDGSWHTVASTLPTAAQAGLTPGTQAAERMQLAGDTYLGESLELAAAPGRPVTALLQSSLNEALADYRAWWTRMAEVFAATLLLAILGAWFLARSVVRPVRMLVERADAIEAGNYSDPITLRHGGELGELVQKFNRMQGAIAEREASIRRHAERDSLTGLVNRPQLEQLTSEAIRSTSGSDRRTAVMIAGLDRFKDINDTLGYQAGDRLLREVGERLSRIAGDDNVVARVAGDEFGILLRTTTAREIPGHIERIAGAFAAPFTADGLTLHLAAGIGLASYPDHGNDAATLLRHADMAKWTAKQKRLPYSIYDGTQDRFSRLRLSLLGELQSAIEHGDLVLHYQPKMDLEAGTVTSAEALVRWQHPLYGLIPPGDFVPMLEHTGNINLVTSWAMRRASAQAAAWHKEGMSLRIAVNMSAYDLRRAGFTEEVEEAVKDEGADAELLSLEITESAVMEDVDQAVLAFRRLRKLGMKLSIDDYGTGYSSMAQLKRLPLDELKIDRSFVKGLEHSTDDEIIVRSTIELGHNMGLKVVGEGVESRAGLNKLRRLNCDTAQGYFISRSLPAADLEAWWQSQGWRTATATRQ
ncbi:MAG TPA: EAL domain-containing protein [Gammaproteobacteria bacterium]|jgi:diguanylate cyclase (GGDEF)-like protein|nr:EAL domain-containing protein [Gammaproteobacteria bacterium]